MSIYIAKLHVSYPMQSIASSLSENLLNVIYEFKAPFNICFFKEHLLVILNGVHTHTQPTGDFLVGETLHDRAGRYHFVWE